MFSEKMHSITLRSYITLNNIHTIRYVCTAVGIIVWQRCDSGAWVQLSVCCLITYTST